MAGNGFPFQDLNFFLHRVGNCVVHYFPAGRCNPKHPSIFGLPYPPPPPQNVNFLKSIFDFLLIFQKIDLINCKIWGHPPPLLETVYFLGGWGDPSLMYCSQGLAHYGGHF